MGESFIKKTWDELPKAVAVALATIIAAGIATGLTLLLGSELREAIGHRVFVLFSATEQILKIIPAFLYLAAFIITLIIALTLWKQLKIEHAPPQKLTKRINYGRFYATALYKHPDLNKHLSPVDIANDAEIRLFCSQCHQELRPCDQSIYCACKTQYGPNWAVSCKETAKRELLEFLCTALPHK